MAEFVLRREPTAQAIAEELPSIVRHIPPDYIRARRWFGSKTREIREVAHFDHARLSNDQPLFLILVQVQYQDDPPELYFLPLLFVEPTARIADRPVDAILRIAGSHGSLVAYDALDSPSVRLLLLRLVAEGRELPAVHGRVACQPTVILGDVNAITQAKVSSAEQSNTSVVYEDAWIMKNFRRIVFGRSRDLEIGQFFSLHTEFRHTPLLAGSVEYHSAEGSVATIAVVQSFVQNRGDGWRYVLEELGALYELARAPRLPHQDHSRLVREWQVELLEAMREMGRVTGEMHRALGSRPDLPHFAPEPIRESDVQTWVQDLHHFAHRALDGLASQRDAYSGPLREQIDRHLSDGPRYFEVVDSFASLPAVMGNKIQIHGDYHLGQVLKTDDTFAVIDFEGEPARPLEHRKAKRCPLEDVAGMLRSLDYAAHAALREAETADQEREQLALWADVWVEIAGEEYLRGYFDAMDGSELIPAPSVQVGAWINFFQAAKAFYELTYELDNRPDWVGIPLKGIQKLM